MQAEADVDPSKDRFFAQLAEISEAMCAAHGKDFAMGALLLAARYIAERDARAAAEGKGSSADLKAQAGCQPAGA